MNLKETIIKQDEKFNKEFPEIECSAHERTSSAMCICAELPDLNEEKRNIKSYLRIRDQAIAEAVREEEREKIKKYIVNEMLICNKEGTPTSRLTSLTCRIKDF